MNINLLPWRENEIKKSKKKFYRQLGIGVCFAILTMGFIHLELKHRIEKMDAILKKLTFAQHQQTRAWKKHHPKVAVDLLEDAMKIHKNRINIEKIVVILTTLAAVIPQAVCLQSITFDEKSNLFLIGTTFQTDEIFSLLQTMTMCRFLKHIHLNTLSTQSHTERFIFQGHI